MTTLVDRPGTEPYELRPYRVTVTANQWDPDEGRWDVIVRAFGPKDASNQALTDARAEGYPQARVSAVVPV